MTWGIILFLAALVFDLTRDYKSWLRNESVNHAPKHILRPIILAPSLAVLVSVLDWKWPYWLILAIPIVVLMEFFVYWIVFDILFNILRGFTWNFTGSVESDDAGSDKLLRKYPSLQFIRIIIACLLITIYILLWK